MTGSLKKNWLDYKTWLVLYHSISIQGAWLLVASLTYYTFTKITEGLNKEANNQGYLENIYYILEQKLRFKPHPNDSKATCGVLKQSHVESDKAPFNGPLNS